jgi:hypothetical protein
MAKQPKQPKEAKIAKTGNAGGTETPAPAAAPAAGQEAAPSRSGAQLIGRVRAALLMRMPHSDSRAVQAACGRVAQEIVAGEVASQEQFLASLSAGLEAEREAHHVLAQPMRDLGGAHRVALRGAYADAMAVMGADA